MPISAPKIPEGLPELMRGLAKSVIKENPDNLYVHAAEYFENLIRERDGELERGYQTFNAYQVYADYKDKSREKLGLTGRTEGSSISDDGEQGDESGSGDSGTKSRGRRRARRARKPPSSREKDNPPTVVEKVASGGAEPPKKNSLSEENAPVPVVEQEVVQVHYNPPEAVPPAARVVSAQSVEADQAVSSVLDDEQILDSDGTGASKETGDELVDHGDDVGTAPSTAEITEPCPPAEENGAMALQDMETCFMHANVDDLMEKQSTDLTAATDDGSKATDAEAKVVASPEVGQDVPEGPQPEVDSNETLNAAEPTVSETTESGEKGDAGVIEKDGKVVENEPANVAPIEVDTSPDEPALKQSDAVPEPLEESAPTVKQVDNVESIITPDDADPKPSDSIEADTTKAAEEVIQELEQPAEDVPQKVTPQQSDEIVTQDDAAIVDTAPAMDVPVEDEAVPAEKSTPEGASVDIPLNEAADEEVVASDAIETGEEKMEESVETDDVGSSEKEIVEPLKLSSRMGIDDNEADGGNDEQTKEPLIKVDDSEIDEKVQEIADIPEATAAEISEPNATQSPQEEEQSTEQAVTEETVESKTVQLNDQSAPDDDGGQHAPKTPDDETNEADENLATTTDGQPPEETGVTNQPAAAIGGEESAEELKSVEVVPVLPDADPATVEPLEEPVTVGQDPEEPQGDEAILDTSITEPAEDRDSEVQPSKGPPSTESSPKKENSAEEKEPSPEPAASEAETANVQVASDVIEQQAEEESDDKEIKASTDEKDDQPRAASTDQEEGEDGAVKDQPMPEKTATTPPESQPSDELIKEDESKEPSSEQVESAEGASDAVEKAEATVDTENGKEPPAEDTSESQPGDIEVPGSPVQADEDVNDTAETGDGSPDNVKSAEEVDPKPSFLESLTLESVMLDTLPELLSDVSGGVGNEARDKASSSNEEYPDKEKSVEEETRADAEGKAEPSVDAGASEPQGGDTTGASAEPPVELPEPAVELNATDQPTVESTEQATVESADKAEGSLEEVYEEPCVKREKREASMEEVFEEPCVKRDVTPTKSGRPSGTDDSGDKQQDQEEREEIKKVDLSQLSKDSAEALFYSLKKSELENQEPPEGAPASEGQPPVNASGSQESNGDEDDGDVVVAEEPPEASPASVSPKRTFTDDFLDEPPIPDSEPVDATTTDGVQPLEDSVQQPPAAARSASEAAEQEDEFNPMVMVSMRSKHFQEQLHSREDIGETAVEQMAPARPPMRRCMTEMSGLQRYDTDAVEDDPIPAVQAGGNSVEEEDQFDGYYIGHIKNKILASSVSVADSDYFEPAQSSEEPADDDGNVRTALETIASTDTESTIASQATIQQAGKRSYLRKHSQNTSTNIPYASFGNAAIDRSLDEFIEREERNKQDEAMAEAATKIQRSYRTHKKRLLRDYHSTMRTFTEDQSAESGGEEYASNVIQIKLDQKRAADGQSPVASGGDGGEESDSTSASMRLQPAPALIGAGRRPMYSLNIDEYDTVARRMTLTRGVALQRTSTPEDDSGKSTNASTDRKPSSLNSVPTPESAPSASSGSGEGAVPPSDSSSEEKSSDPPKVAEEPRGRAELRRSSSGEQQDGKEGHPASSTRSRSQRTAPAAMGRELDAKLAGRTTSSSSSSATTTAIGQLDVQSLLLIARQRTMPVQMDSSVIRVLPKHMRKRISSAGMLNGGKRKV